MAGVLDGTRRGAVFRSVIVRVCFEGGGHLDSSIELLDEAPVQRIEEPSAEPSRDRITKLGDRLRAERERRGVTLKEVSDSTKIPKHTLESLESHDWGALPETVFTRGHLRTYAQYLGLDPKYWLNVYARELRISHAKNPSVNGQDEDEVMKAVLERAARTRGAKLPRSWPKAMWISLGLVGACAAAIAVSSVFNPLGRARNESIEVGSVAPKAPDPKVSSNPPAPAGDAIPRPGETSQAFSPGAHVTSVASPLVDPPAPATAERESRLRIPDYGVGTGVVGLQLVGRSASFGEGTVVWFWTRVLDGRSGDTIRHVWIHEGRVVGMTRLKVRGSQWRTHSRRLLTKGSIGEWTVEARDPEDRVLASTAFTCAQAAF